MEKFIQFRRQRLLPSQVQSHEGSAGPCELESLKVTEYVTMSEADAVKEYHRMHPDRKVSYWVALDGYMSANHARSAPAPLELGVGIAEYVELYVRSSGGVHRAAKQLGIHWNVINDILNGKRNKLPSYVLRKMGVKQVVTLLPADETG